MKSSEFRQENALVKMLGSKMERDGLFVADLAKLLHVSQSYISQIFRGLRPTNGFSLRVHRRIADYLGIPPAQVFLMSGIMELSDFSSEQTLPQKLTRARELMLLDPRWVGYVPNDADWERIPQEVKMLVGLLYEDASGHKIFASGKSGDQQASL